MSSSAFGAETEKRTGADVVVERVAFIELLDVSFPHWHWDIT